MEELSKSNFGGRDGVFMPLVEDVKQLEITL